MGLTSRASWPSDRFQLPNVPTPCQRIEKWKLSALAECLLPGCSSNLICCVAASPLRAHSTKCCSVH